MGIKILIHVSKIIKFITKDIENNNNQMNNNTSNNNGDVNNNISNKNNVSNVPNMNSADKKEEIKKSDNNYLSSIILSNGSINFDKDYLSYDIIVDYETTKIDVEAKVEDNKASVTGNGSYNLNVGSNIIKLVIKAEDESERTYILNINREEKEIIVEEENKVESIEKENNEIVENKRIENNYIITIVIILLIFVLGVVGLVIWKKKDNK